MSKSVTRVRAALEAAGLPADIREPGETRTAEQAAAAVGCAPDQIVKSLIFRGEESGHVRLFLVPGGRRLSPVKAAAAAGEALGKADAALVRAETGFAIGGVAPVGHIAPVATWMDPRLPEFAEVWAAAGTPRHVFSAAPEALRRVTGAVTRDVTE
ncbi:YbaK/EbsC family protein [Rhodosalinus sediminis]|uniref:YbaK/EbsC family protein n=1 Tax=Rhodosalinus sediminis TaxID=1940533 RepID=A0A3D9BU78_9RHOB|nr:YbaK/EbsC family protein [Rhodosalinus sediminis]REC57048.1 YbaK/EbsC family protein [Rhodosalinus sediminis]